MLVKHGTYFDVTTTDGHHTASASGFIASLGNIAYRLSFYADEHLVLINLTQDPINHGPRSHDH